MNRFLSAGAILLLGFGLTLSLTACDSSDEEVNDLVGRWAFSDGTSRTLITVDQAQQVVDRTQPGQGGLQVTGHMTGTLRYFGYAYRSSDDLTLSVGSYDYRDNSAPYPRLSLELNPSSLYLIYYGSEVDARSLFSEASPSSYSFSNNVLTVNGVTFTDGTEEVGVDGTLTFATRSVPANQATAIDTYYEYDDEDAFELEFREDGDFIVRTEGESERGTWEIVGDALRLRFDEDDEDEIVSASYEIDGNTLRLELSADYCGSDEDREECFGYVEDEYLLIPGSLTNVQGEESLTLQRASGDSIRSGSEQAQRETSRTERGVFIKQPAPARAHTR